MRKGRIRIDSYMGRVGRLLAHHAELFREGRCGGADLLMQRIRVLIERWQDFRRGGRSA